MTDPVRTAIVARLNTVEGIGRVHAFERYASDMARLALLYKTDAGVIQGWYVSRGAVKEKRLGKQAEEMSDWKIVGFRSLSDGDESEIVFDDLVDAVRAAFRADHTLGFSHGVSIWGEDEAGIQVESSEPVMFAGVLCHMVRLGLTVHRYI